MATLSFLDILTRERGAGAYVGDEFGGAAGADGRGLPCGYAGNFLFATGIECSYPTVRVDGRVVRRDQLEETGHYARFKEDFALVKELGLRVLRYGLPYHRVSTAPNRYDWEFADAAMRELQRMEITPILDLLHFGVPDWIGDFQNPELPLHFAAYAGAVAERYPHVRFYTPVNEIFVASRLSAHEGKWNECLKSDRAFVNAIKHLSAASILATHEIARRRPDCVIVQAETSEYIHEARATPTREVRLQNELRFLALDLLYAHPTDGQVTLFLQDNGMTRAEMEWFMGGEPPGYQIMGNDYYGRNESIVLPDGRVIHAQDVFGWYQLTRQYYERYRKPLMHTETNALPNQEGDAVEWLWKQWVNLMQMRRDGVPVLGFTWYSLLDQLDWDTQLAEKNDRVNPNGLFDLDRRIRPVGKAYRQLVEEFGQITVVPHGEMFVLSEEPARLKTEV